MAKHIHYTSVSPELSLQWEKIRISVRHQEPPYSLFTKDRASESTNKREKKGQEKEKRVGFEKAPVNRRKENNFFFRGKPLN